MLVPVEPLRPLLPPVGVVRARFALTEREADVALLLAQGLTDGAVAERLSLSPHTARRPSERVLRKLRVHSRAAVALTLLGAAGKESRTGMPRSDPDAYPNRD